MKLFRTIVVKDSDEAKQLKEELDMSKNAMAKQSLLVKNNNKTINHLRELNRNANSEIDNLEQAIKQIKDDKLNTVNKLQGDLELLEIDFTKLKEKYDKLNIELANLNYIIAKQNETIASMRNFKKDENN